MSLLRSNSGELLAHRQLSACGPRISRLLRGFASNSFCTTPQLQPKLGTRHLNSLRALRALRAHASAPSTPHAKMSTLESLSFDNLSVHSLPVDLGENRPRQVPGHIFSKVEPTPVRNPTLVAASAEALALLDLDKDQIQRPEFVEYFSGNRVLPGAEPAAHCYCGHQFGHFSGQLGDGATMYLGEVLNCKGERWELQFKGAGKTPYSRSADGRKVLRSSIREFLCSEAMYHLGIPTTRAGTVVTSDSRVVRDIFYDGNAIQERCSIITRIAPTFFRFGSFEIFKPQDSVTGRVGPSSDPKYLDTLLPQLLHHVIKTYYPNIWDAFGGDGLTAGLSSWMQVPMDTKKALQEMYLEWYREVIRRTASLVAAWQCVGWCHGVLNTDNMSIVGVTIDYGPFGFMDRYDPDFICNGSDDSGRYDYKSQPSMCRWNCEKLAEAVQHVLPFSLSKKELPLFDQEFDRTYMAIMRKKLGLIAVSEADDRSLVDSLLSAMQSSGADFTNTFRCLSRMPMPSATGEGCDFQPVLDYILTQTADVATLAKAAGPRIPEANLQMLTMLAMRDPQLLHQLGASPQMLQKELDKLKESQRLAKMTADEKHAADVAVWTSWLQRYSQRLAREAVAGADNAERVRVMNGTNPKYILRNWIAQQAIEKAEKGDYSEVNYVLNLLKQPYSEQEAAEFEESHMAAEPAGDRELMAVSNIEAAERAAPTCRLVRPKASAYADKPPDWAEQLCVT